MTMVPFVIEKTAQGERSYDIFSRLLRDRIVFLNGPISTGMSHAIVAQLLFLEAENDNQDISLYINSPGGEVTAGMAIYDVMQFVKCDVATFVTGQAASMGSLLSQAGTAGKRFILPNARHMCHQPSGGAGGMASDMKIQVEEIIKLKEILTNIYVKHNSCGKTYQEFDRIMDRDTYLSAEESVKFGLADKVIASRPVIKK
jgi:ATP-dependent Clp protease, protease subunit